MQSFFILLKVIISFRLFSKPKNKDRNNIVTLEVLLISSYYKYKKRIIFTT